MKHNEIVSANRVIYQEEIFPELVQVFGYLTNKHEQLIQMLDLIDLNTIYPQRLWDSFFGRPKVNRHNFIRAFLAKAIWNISETKDLIEYLKVDKALRVICGFDGRSNKVPSESTFSREFKELSNLGVGDKIHKYLITEHCSSELYEHLSFDASSIEVSEKSQKVEEKKRTVVEQQIMTNEKILADLPAVCNFGTKKNSNGKTHTWKGYKLHVVANEYSIPIVAMVTSASVHDSLCAIPLIRETEQRVDGLYYLADKAYDSTAIRAEVKSHGKVPLIDFKNNRNGSATDEFIGNQVERYKKRTFVEGVFSNLKMNYLPNYILYRGIEKIRTVLSFALSIIAAIQIIKYA